MARNKIRFISLVLILNLAFMLTGANEAFAGRLFASGAGAGGSSSLWTDDDPNLKPGTDGDGVALYDSGGTTNVLQTVSGSAITFAGVGATNNNSMSFDFEAQNGYIEVTATSAPDSFYFNDSIFMAPGTNLFMAGSTFYTTFGLEWKETDTDHAQAQFLLNSESFAGILAFIDSSDESSVNRYVDPVANPTIRMWSNDENVATDYMDMYHDATDGRIISGGGDLRLDGAAGSATHVNAGHLDIDFIVGDDGSADIFKSDAALGSIIIDGSLDVGTVETFTDADATPDVGEGTYWNTNTTGVTITDFDGANIVDGQVVIVTSKGAIVYDCTGAGFKCGTTDITTAAGDVTGWKYDGTDWYLLFFTNQSDDINEDGGSGTPSGSDTEVQYNNAGSFGADANFTYTASTDILKLIRADAGAVFHIQNTGTSREIGMGTGSSFGHLLYDSSGGFLIGTQATVTDATDSGQAAIWFESNKKIGINTASTTAGWVTIESGSTSIPGLLINEETSHTGEVLQINTSLGAETFSVEAGGLIATLVGLDGIGAIDLDYGSDDITDHTFVTDSTGDAEIVLPADSIGPDELDSTTGNYDFSSVDFELPQASAAAPDADGEVELDMTDGKLVIQNSTDHAALGVATDVVYGSLIKNACITLLEPDKIQAVIDNVPMMGVESTAFPHGIEITNVYLKTDASSTLSVVLEKWSSPTDGAPDTLTTIATAASTEATEAPDTDGTVGTSEIIMLDLDTTDVNWCELCIEYYEPIA